MSQLFLQIQFGRLATTSTTTQRTTTTILYCELISGKIAFYYPPPHSIMGDNSQNICTTETGRESSLPAGWTVIPPPHSPTLLSYGNSILMPQIAWVAFVDKNKHHKTATTSTFPTTHPHRRHMDDAHGRVGGRQEMPSKCLITTRNEVLMV